MDTHSHIRTDPLHDHEQDPHTLGLHSGEEEHHEKKSVLKKVKAKAKKIKETITGHNQEHHHGGHHDAFDPDQNRYEEEEKDDLDEDEQEIVNDPEVHGSPMYESAGARNFAMSDEDVNIARPKVGVGERLHFEEDPHAPNEPFQAADPGNYQTKVTDPTGAGRQEAGMGPMIRAFEKMEVRKEPDHGVKPSFPSTTTTAGSHDRFSPEVPTSTIHHIPQNTQSVPGSGEPMHVEGQPHQSSYTEKISSATSTIADKAISAKNAVSSKLGYGGNEGTKTGTTTETHGGDPNKGITSTISGTAIGAKDAVASKLGYGGNEDTSTETNREEPNKGITSTIAGAAIGAKDTVASKLGYGGTGGSEGTTTTDVNRGEANKGVTSKIADTAISGKNTGNENTVTEENRGGEHGQGPGVTGYGRQIASTVTGKLAPVYGAIAGAGSAVVSKVHGSTGTGSGTGTGTGTNTGTETGADKGATMKGYLAEKLKPGEEDKALSEVISDALHKRKEEVGHKPMGKVTESPEVARRLGTESDEAITGGENPGQSYVDKFKGAVTSWFGKGAEMNPSKMIHDNSDQSPYGTTQSHGTTQEQSSMDVGERKVQESTT